MSCYSDRFHSQESSLFVTHLIGDTNDIMTDRCEKVILLFIMSWFFHCALFHRYVIPYWVTQRRDFPSPNTSSAPPSCKETCSSSTAEHSLKQRWKQLWRPTLYWTRQSSRRNCPSSMTMTSSGLAVVLLLCSSSSLTIICRRHSQRLSVFWRFL